MVWLPPLKGKEKRKTSPSAEGLLGVEGTNDAVIISALERAGLTHTAVSSPCKKITKTDMFTLGLSGGEGSSQLRQSLCRFIGIPHLPANTLLDALNSLYTYNSFLEMIEKWKAEETEN